VNSFAFTKRHAPSLRFLVVQVVAAQSVVMMLVPRGCRCWCRLPVTGIQSWAGCSTTNHLPQLVFAGEVGLQDVEILDQVTAARQHGFLGSDLAIGLDAKFELGKERMGDTIGRESDVTVRKKLLAEHIGEGVVFLVEGEDGGVWGPGVNLLFDLLLTIPQDKSLGTIWSVHLAKADAEEPNK